MTGFFLGIKQQSLQTESYYRIGIFVCNDKLCMHAICISYVYVSKNIKIFICMPACSHTFMHTHTNITRSCAHTHTHTHKHTQEARYTFMKIIRDSLFTYINDRCSCGFNESGLTNEQITCDLAMYHYSAELLTSLETHNQYVPSQILEDISEWPKEHPKILLNSTRFGGPALLNLSFIVESTEVSFSGDASGDDVSEPESSGVDIVSIPPGGGDQEDPTDKSVVVVDKQEQPDDSHGRRNRMSVLGVGALLTLVLILAL